MTELDELFDRICIVLHIDIFLNWILKRLKGE